MSKPTEVETVSPAVLVYQDVPVGSEPERVFGLYRNARICVALTSRDCVAVDGRPDAFEVVEFVIGDMPQLNRGRDSVPLEAFAAFASKGLYASVPVVQVGFEVRLRLRNVSNRTASCSVAFVPCVTRP